MGFWPFGGGKRQRAAESTSHMREQSLQSEPSENMGALEKASTDVNGNTKESTKREQGDKTRRLSKTQTPSQGQQPRSQTDSVAIPTSRRHSRLVAPLSEKQLYQQNPTSQSSLGPENFDVVRPPPTLHACRSEQDSNVARRKSSKRKAEDYAREREVRAMSSSSPIAIPRRPTSFHDSGPLQKETREIPGPLNRKFNRPTSQVSLPLPAPLPDVDNPAHQNSFKVSMFAALSPRPTIRYDANPRQTRGKQPQRPNPLTRPLILEEGEDAEKQRIDDLADDLDAGGLRELMERDRRRKERKKQQDQARLQRRLQRRAERQREEEDKKARTEEYVSATASRVQGLGVDSTASKSVAAHTTATGSSLANHADATDPFADPKPQVVSPVMIRNPFEDEKDMDVMEDGASDMDPDPPIPAKSPLRKIKTDVAKNDGRTFQARLSPPVSPVPRLGDRQSMSQGSLLNREATTDMPESGSLTGGASNHSSQRLSSWTAFFRRGTRRKLSSSFQGRSTPSEFSNTSRESFAARKQPPPMVTPRTFRRADSATPQRTMSKFREDLPEFPISPPDSRMQSPEASIPPTTTVFNQAVTTAEQRKAAADKLEVLAYIPSSPISTGVDVRGNKPSIDLDAPLAAKPDLILSQSLASVDSEASWLSGKPLHRKSHASQRLTARRSSLTRTMPGAFDDGNDIGSPLENSARMNVNEHEVASKTDEMWHTSLGRQPTLVRQASRAKSKEGLLKEYAAKEPQSSSADTDDEGVETGHDEPEAEVALMRARSVDYQRHARHMSAGSARLLDIRRSMHSEDLLSPQIAPTSQEQITQERPPTSSG